MVYVFTEHLLEAVVVSELAYLAILTHMFPQAILFVISDEDITNYIAMRELNLARLRLNSVGKHFN